MSGLFVCRYPKLVSGYIIFKKKLLLNNFVSIAAFSIYNLQQV